MLRLSVGVYARKEGFGCTNVDAKKKRTRKWHERGLKAKKTEQRRLLAGDLAIVAQAIAKPPHQDDKDPNQSEN